MGIVVWLLIGTVVAAIFAPAKRYAFPTGRTACLIGALAGAFLGGGIVTVAAGSGQTCLSALSTAAALCGALAIVTAVGWAGQTEQPPA